MGFINSNKTFNGIKKVCGEITNGLKDNSKLKYGAVAAGASVTGVGLGAVGTGMYVTSNVANGVKNFLFDK